MKQVTESGRRLQRSYSLKKAERKPVVSLSPEFVIDDRILEKPTLLVGQVGSGKSTLLTRVLMPQIFAQMDPGDSAVIFCVKDEMIDGFYHPEEGDVLLDCDAKDPENIWNLFEELRSSECPEAVAAELCDVIFSGYENRVQPLFTKAPMDLLRSLLLYLYRHYEERTGAFPTTSTLIGFYQRLGLKDRVVDGRIEKGLLTLIREEPELSHLRDYFGEQGRSDMSLGILAELRSVIEDSFRERAFCQPGRFSARAALQKGRKVFIRFQPAKNTKGTLRYFDMILDQLVKNSLREDGRKKWFFFDEFSLLGHLQYLDQALAFGRGAGFRIIAAIQDAQLMEKNYEKHEADSILSLFPNVFCFFTSGPKSRELLSSRYGANLVSVLSSSGRQELLERKAILDEDFYELTAPGDCIVSLAGQPPFLFRGHEGEASEALSISVKEKGGSGI